MRLPDVDLATGGMGAAPPWMPAALASLRRCPREKTVKPRPTAPARPEDKVFAVVRSRQQARHGVRLTGCAMFSSVMYGSVVTPVLCLMGETVPEHGKQRQYWLCGRFRAFKTVPIKKGGDSCISRSIKRPSFWG